MEWISCSPVCWYPETLLYNYFYHHMNLLQISFINNRCNLESATHNVELVIVVKAVMSSGKVLYLAHERKLVQVSFLLYFLCLLYMECMSSAIRAAPCACVRARVLVCVCVCVRVRVLVCVCWCWCACVCMCASQLRWWEHNQHYDG